MVSQLGISLVKLWFIVFISLILLSIVDSLKTSRQNSPTIEGGRFEIRIFSGFSLKILCKAKRNVTWNLPNNENLYGYKNPKSRTTIVYGRMKQQFMAMLILENVTYTDTGKYTCMDSSEGINSNSNSTIYVTIFGNKSRYWLYPKNHTTLIRQDKKSIIPCKCIGCSDAPSLEIDGEAVHQAHYEEKIGLSIPSDSLRGNIVGRTVSARCKRGNEIEDAVFNAKIVGPPKSTILSKAQIIGISAAASFLALIVLLLLLFLIKRQKMQKKLQENSEESLSMIPINSYSQQRTVKQFNRIQTNDLKFNPVLDLVGSGNFCSVYRAMLQSTQVAAKRVKGRHEIRNPADFDKNCMSFFEEAFLINQLDSPYIVEVHGMCMDTSPKILILEFMDQGSLDFFLVRNRHELKQADLVRAAIHLARACQYLHEMMIIHRDIAARNSLCQGRAEDFRVKLGDFGLAKDIASLGEYTPTGDDLIPRPCPPDHGKYGYYTDVWYFSFFLWELYNLTFNDGETDLESPLSKEDVSRICQQTLSRKLDLEKYRSAPFWATDEMKLLINSCWHDRCHKRPNFEEIVADLTAMESSTTELSNSVTYCTPVSLMDAYAL